MQIAQSAATIARYPMIRACADSRKGERKMATRNLLHKSHLEAFKEWLINAGWQICDTKGIYEVLRASKGSARLIVYSRADAKEHYSVRDIDYSTVCRFLRWRKENGK